jgi:hypothetical protein
VTGPTFTNAQIDRLGERLRVSEPSEADLRLLDDYRRSFTEPYGYSADRSAGEDDDLYTR